MHHSTKKNILFFLLIVAFSSNAQVDSLHIKKTLWNITFGSNLTYAYVASPAPNSSSFKYSPYRLTPDIGYNFSTGFSRKVNRIEWGINWGYARYQFAYSYEIEDVVHIDKWSNLDYHDFITMPLDCKYYLKRNKKYFFSGETSFSVLLIFKSKTKRIVINKTTNQEIVNQQNSFRYNDPQFVIWQSIGFGRVIYLNKRQEVKIFSNIKYSSMIDGQQYKEYRSLTFNRELIVLELNFQIGI